MANQQTRGRVQNLTNAGKGRKKGVPNKNTVLAKQAIATAFDELGGTRGLVDWAKDDPDNLKVFYATIWPKIIPVQTELTGKDGEAIQIEQRVKENADAVSSAIASLVERARSSGMDGTTQH